MPQISLHTPLYDMTLFEADGAITALEWGWVEEQDTSSLLIEAKSQIDAFFDEGGRAFDLPLRPQGSKFEHKVWSYMQKIPSGETRSYQALAKEIGSVARAIGRASARNPIPVLIPCHRVIATNGALTGYSGEGGVETKRDLLIIEGALPPRFL